MKRLLRMPRSRNSRSSSPLKSLKTTTGQSEYDRIFQNVQEMFCETVDADVIYYVLTECHWRSEEAIDKLLAIVEKSEGQPVKSQSKLQEIAEGILGPLRHGEQGSHTPPGSGQNPISAGASFERAIGHPGGTKENHVEEHKAVFKSASSPIQSGLQARGGLDRQSLNTAGTPDSSDSMLSWDFPPLPSESSNEAKLLSDSQQRISKSDIYNSESKPQAESWRAIKAPKSSKNSSNSSYQNLGNESESPKSGPLKQEHHEDGVFTDDPAVMKAKIVEPVRPRLEMNRNFPVRLLSRSPEEVHEKLSFPQTMHNSVSESVLSNKTKGNEDVQPESFELDETVIKCISEINNELLDEMEKKTDKGSRERSRSSSIRSQASENESVGTGCSTPDPSHTRTSTPSNKPMTLPVIGLSVEAPEFVPRPKKTKIEEVAKTVSETPATARSSPLSSATLKVDTKPIPIPVTSSNQGLSPVIRMGSPSIAVVSSANCAISPPANLPVTNSAHLTGSPMFITPKWQPVFRGIYTPQQPPPPLQPRLVAQQLPPNYRFPPPVTQFPPYSRVVYPVGAQPVFRVAGIPPRLSQVPMPQGVQMVTEVNDRVAMATGQPIMATGHPVMPTAESLRPAAHLAGMEALKQRNEVHQSMEVCVETVKAITKAGKKVMVIVRGLPGSGKSTLARAVRLDGIVLSTDDYFTKGDLYEYDPDKLTEAHQWNRERAKEAIKMGTTPVVIDNTNTQKWEFKPYVSMAQNNNYYVEIMEPDTPWKFKPKELAKRTLHGVPEDQIQRMLSRYEKNLTVAVLSNNKTKKPVTNGSVESLNGSFSKENSLSPTSERKPVKSVKSETRRSRSKGKSNKIKDVKRTTKLPRSSSSPVLDHSNVNELQDWQISEEDRTWETQTESPIAVQSIESTNTSFTDKWTHSDLNENGIKTSDSGTSFENNETIAILETPLNSNSVFVPNSGFSSVLSSQDEGSFYSCHSDIPSITSSKTASPIIEYNIIETYKESNHNNEAHYTSDLKVVAGRCTEKEKAQDIEKELSEEVLGYVNEVMQEHSSMNPNELSQEDKLRVEEELKAFLQFYPIDDEEQRRKAEILISLKLSKNETEEHSYMNTYMTEEIPVEQCNVNEETELYTTPKHVEVEFNENFIVRAGETLIQNNTSLNNNDLESVTEANLDLDNSLNKEVANIFHNSDLHMEVSCLDNNNTQMTCANETATASMKEIDNNDRIVECNFENETIHFENNEIAVSCNIENTGITKSDKIEEPSYQFTNDIANIYQHCDSTDRTSETKNSKDLDSLYEFDSAIIKAEKSDFMETDSLYETDSAIIAASADSLEKDSLLEADSAIIAASSDVIDTDCLFETDSAIIAASKELLDMETVNIDDSDIMKRLKVSVEELKYWGKIETSEDVLVDRVSTEWDGCDPNDSDQWHIDKNIPLSREAKPQRHKRCRSVSNYEDENGSKVFDYKEMLFENKVSDKQESGEADSIISAVSLSSNNTLAANSCTDKPQSIIYHDIHENKDSLLESDTSVHPVSSAGETSSLTFHYNSIETQDKCASESLNSYIDKEDSATQLDVTCVDSKNAFEVPVSLINTNQNVESVGLVNELDFMNRPSDVDIDNSIFVSDDEEVSNESHLLKVDSGSVKAENSDDYIFVSDDDMEYLNANLQVERLQTVSIQEENILCIRTDEENQNNNEKANVNTCHELQVSEPAVSNSNSSSVEHFVNELSTVSEHTVFKSETKAPDKVDVSSTDNLTERSVEAQISYLQSSPSLNTVETDRSTVSQCEDETSPLAQSQASPKKRKPSKGRLAEKLSKPFFDISDKEKFASNDWSTFSTSYKSTSVLETTNTDGMVQINNVKSEGTLTESGDFRILNLYCQGETVDYVHEYKFVRTRSRSIDDEELTKSNLDLQKTANLEVRKVDKSSFTEDLEKDVDTENIQFLKTCFPHISEDELDCVLLNCANNVEWALNLLIDWKYHLDFTDEEKEKFANEILKCKRCPSPEITDTNNVNLNELYPDSLLNLCFKKIETENIAARDDLEKQLIQTGKERLDRIEDDNITKIRLRRSTSLSESSFDTSRSSVSASHSYESVRRSVSDPHQNMESVFLDSCNQHYGSGQTSNDFLIDPSKASNKEQKGHRVSFDLETTNLVTDKNIQYDNDEQITDKLQTPHAEQLTGSGLVDSKDSEGDTVNNENQINYINYKISENNITDTALVNDSVADDKNQIQVNDTSENDVGNETVQQPGGDVGEESPFVFTLMLDSSIISQLEHLFGPVGKNSIAGHGDVQVPVNLETARLLHQCVRNGLEDDRQALYKQLKDDEEYARRLQEEQDLSDMRSTKRPTPSVPRREPVKPLAEIMQEEMTKQSMREELQKFLESEGGHVAIATRIKRKKLHESFPTIDTTLLDQIFQVNCYNLSETIESIKTSLSYQPVQNVMTREMEEEYDRKLIESFKQQSSLDMLDNFGPSMSEDYEDDVDAEYEDYRGEATLHHRLRQECFQKAQEAYRKGLKQVASFYSQQGHLHTQKLKEANMRASEQILEDRHSDLETKMTLDLHGLHVDEAIAALDRILPEKERERYKSHLIIITGRGRHSHHGVPRLRPAVLAYLQKHQYSFTELHPGAFRVTLKSR